MDPLHDLCERVMLLPGESLTRAEMLEMLAEVRRDWVGERVYIGASPGESRRRRSARDAALMRDWIGGDRVAALARRYGISRQRVYVIIKENGGRV